MKNQYCPDTCSHPGATLADILHERGEGIPAFAERAGLEASVVADLIDGFIPVSAVVARALSKALGMSAQFWRNRQRQYDATLRDQRRADTVFNAIIKYKREHCISPSVRDLVAACGLPGVASTSSMARLLDRLEAQGKITRYPKGAARNIQIPGARWELDEVEE